MVEPAADLSNIGGTAAYITMISFKVSLSQKKAIQKKKKKKLQLDEVISVKVKVILEIAFQFLRLGTWKKYKEYEQQTWITTVSRSFICLSSVVANNFLICRLGPAAFSVQWTPFSLEIEELSF